MFVLGAGQTSFVDPIFLTPRGAEGSFRRGVRYFHRPPTRGKMGGSHNVVERRNRHGRPLADANPRRDARALGGLHLTRSYLLGALHDGTVRLRTIRISQREESYVLFLKRLVESLGGRAWTYREGRKRQLYVVEFSRSFLRSHRLRTQEDVFDYVRGYFDAEGGVSSDPSNPYVYFAQKDRVDLEELQRFLTRLETHTGRIHNPSRRVDPDYWRFYVGRHSLREFARLIGSWHPGKHALLQKMIPPTTGDVKSRIPRRAPA